LEICRITTRYELIESYISAISLFWTYRTP
jgi:hypothetical protein